jgi:hypothetical protein
MHFYIKVEPRSFGDLGGTVIPDSMIYSSEEILTRAYKERCREIAALIKRHVDNIGSVTIVEEPSDAQH